MPKTTPEVILHKAAALLAAGNTILETAKQCGVDEKTIDRWKQQPNFLSALQKANEEMRTRVLTHGAALKEVRILAKRKRIRDIMRVMRKRAGKPECGGAAWDDTGLMVQRPKMIGSGEMAMLTTEFEWDTAGLQMISQLEREIAEEMGELRKPPTTPVKDEVLSETAMMLTEVYSSPEELAEFKAKFLQVVQRRQTTTSE
jgi:hypothetical protein